MKKLLIIIGAAAIIFAITGCDSSRSESGQPASASGATKASVTVPIGSDGLTAEQRNIAVRIKEDNKPGAIKHLYVISPYSGQVILYSTVKGKVTSGGKRLTPNTVNAEANDYSGQVHDGFAVLFGDDEKFTGEVLQDDGTYGSSGDYLFWLDSQGRYHQHYLTGGQIIHISSEPISVKSVIINVESVNGA